MKNRTLNLVGIRHFFYALCVAVFLVGCDAPTQYVQIQKTQPYLIIESVELSNSDKLMKYKYTVHDWSGKVVFWLDEKYNIGDTLRLGKNCH